MQFLYGNHVLKSGLGRITEGTPGYTGVVVYSMSGEAAPQGSCLPAAAAWHRGSPAACPLAVPPGCARLACWVAGTLRV